MDVMEERLLMVLDRHKGQRNRIGMRELSAEVMQRQVTHLINDTAELRIIIRRLRRQGTPICSLSDKYNPGYYLAETPEELMEFTERHRKRGLTSLAQAAALLKIGLPELLGQLQLEAEERA